MLILSLICIRGYWNIAIKTREKGRLNLTTHKHPHESPLITEDELTRLPDGEGEQPKKRGRKPGSKNSTGGKALTKTTLRQLFEMYSGGVVMLGKPVYALSPPEIDAMTDSWYAVIEQYPGFGKYVAVGGKFTVWAQAAITTALIVDSKMKLEARMNETNNPQGAAFSNNGNDWQRQNYTNGAVAADPSLPHSS